MARTKLQAFNEKWCNGCGDEMCVRANRIVLHRGSVPADVVFIGEAPGHKEDTHGLPFIGPTKQVMEDIILLGLPQGVRWCLTNLVSCIPTDEKKGKTHTPLPEHIRSCQPRLEEFLRLCKPRMVVAVGKTAEDCLKKGFLFSIKLPDTVKMTVVIDHPASILRQNIAFQGMTVQRMAARVAEGWDNVTFHDDA